MVDSCAVSEAEKMYEEMFAYRYTSEDPDYQETISQPIPPCPCVTGYYIRSRQNNYDNRNQFGRGRGNWRGRGNGHHSNYNQGQRWRDEGQAYRCDNEERGHWGQNRGRRDDGQGHRHYNEGHRGRSDSPGYERQERHYQGHRHNPY
ncbi:RNA guanine-N7 methyltransferase activating subunit-like [Dreissena polymorpha]|uniref:Uncharacterized protein n=1 Tax=Dreissena polymorpha TaxID=45954 RepID=A0A9D4S5J5_DREPO|nr:RNA guanine-N7 methyltransferase activating subunit-like [Dreissena polymorpha]KAH3891328.1 hypothetical protein DPMN_015422 [Dreissena polymorpha]